MLEEDERVRLEAGELVARLCQGKPARGLHKPSWQASLVISVGTRGNASLKGIELLMQTARGLETALTRSRQRIAGAWMAQCVHAERAAPSAGDGNVKRNGGASCC
mgnify:CR=1 FL=1